MALQKSGWPILQFDYTQLFKYFESFLGGPSPYSEPLSNYNTGLVFMTILHNKFRSSRRISGGGVQIQPLSFRIATQKWALPIGPPQM